MAVPEPWEQLDTFDIYTYLIICPLGILASIALMVVHIMYKELRKQPGDLIFMIAFSELLLGIHWFGSAIRTTLITSAPDDGDTFCKFNSYLALIAATMDTFYNASFLLYVLFALRSSIKKSWKPRRLYHIANAGIVVFMLLVSHKGRNKYGTCSVIVTRSSLTLGAIMMFLSIVLSAVVYFHTKSNLPSMGIKMAKLRRDFLNFYGSYIKAYILILCVVFFSFLSQLLGDNQSQPGIHKTVSGVIFNIGRIGNSAKALLPLVLFFIRSQDPALQNRIFKPVQNVANQFTQLIKDISPLKKDNTNTTLPLDSDSDADPTTRPASNTRLTDGGNLEQELLTDTDDMYWMEMLPGKVKEAFTRTFLASIMYYYPGHLAHLIKEGKRSLPMHALESLDLEVRGEDLMRTLDTTDAICNCRMTIFAPMLFRDILMHNNRVVNFDNSFSIFFNADNIREAGENKGGASGELFMFSHDNQLIIKTVTHDDEKVLSKVLYDYSQYHTYHKGSIMAKVLGMFQFVMEGSTKPIKLIVLENIFTIPRTSVLRKYDVKGSNYQRKVLARPGDLDKSAPIKNVLKDLDFTEIEREVNFLDKQHRQNILATIKRDADFFLSHGLIDYSLIIGVVKRQLCDQESINRELEAGGYHLIATPNPEIFYVIGIIDYLQLYTWGKAFERLFKRLKTCNPRLDTSSQPPEKYAARFFRFAEKHFL